MKRLLFFSLLIISCPIAFTQWTTCFKTSGNQIVHVMSSPTDSVCWFITNKDSLFKTEDVGQSWSKISPSAPSFVPSGLFVVNKLIAFKSANAYLYKTINGGVSWYNVFSGISSQPPVVWMRTDVEGVMAYSGQLYKTTDGGDNWTTSGVVQPPANIINASGKGNLFAIGDTLWVCLQGSGIARSPDFGTTWIQPANAGLYFSGLPHISFGNTTLGLAIRSNSSFVYVTRNGGQTWLQAENSLGLNEDVLVHGSRCWYIPNPADHQYIRYSADSGVSWIQQLADPNGFDVLERSRNGVRLWTGTDSGKVYTLYDSSSVLALQDMYLSGEAKKNGTVLLSWNRTGQNEKYFIERSANDGPFEKIAGPLSGLRQNEWTDLNPLSGKNFYRLSIWLNGMQTYSNTFSILMANQNDVTLVYRDGNPQILITAPDAGLYQLRIYSVDGRLASSSIIRHAGGKNSYPVQKTTCSGIMIMEISGQNMKWSARFSCR